MLPPPDPGRLEGAGPAPALAPWALRILVSLGIGIAVLFGWSAAASADGARSASDPVGGAVGTVTGSVEGAVAPVAPVTVPPVSPVSPVIVPPLPPVVGSVTDGAARLAVPSTPVAPTLSAPTGLLGGPSVPALPAPPRLPVAPVPPPVGPGIGSPLEGVDVLSPPQDPLAGGVDGLLPAVDGPVRPGVAGGPGIDGADRSSVGGPVPGVVSAFGTGDPAAVLVGPSGLDGHDVDRGPARSGALAWGGLLPVSAPADSQPGPVGIPAVPTPVPACSASASVDRASPGSPPTTVFGSFASPRRSDARSLLGDDQARASSIDRARPGFAPD